MTRRGFALLAVLWVIALVTALTGVAIAAARIGTLTTRNRVLLTRAAWAREGCIEILSARFAQGVAGGGVAIVDLGRGTWCDATLDEPATKLNLNLADRAALATLFRILAPGRDADSLADAVLARRAREPFADVLEVAEVPSFTNSLLAQVSPFLTTRGTGFIDFNTAPPQVLATLPGITEEALEYVVARRSESPPRSASLLVDWLPPQARTALLARYPEFAQDAVFAPPEYVAFVRGGVRGTSILAHVTVTLVPVGGRLAVIRRESE